MDGREKHIDVHHFVSRRPLFHQISLKSLMDFFDKWREAMIFQRKMGCSPA